MKIYKNFDQRKHYVEKSCLDLDYKQRIRDSLSIGNATMVLTEEFSIITFRKVFKINNAYSYDMEVSIYGYNPKNLAVLEVKSDSRDYVEQKLAININGRAISFNVATAEKLFNQSSVITEIDFKMRKLLIRV